ncbi:Extradiol ring-cleavage dioxygenase, class III enzyme, subunit B [Pholiota conissans]|uniref:Extradiol ring-cleavage dioxygenase, class III enzyme, subunit B n=1 Tax=Pholiota conissans TaxID=109636 RepID=A0A9P5YN08_9AGAR|nr:Extradiol ring-cleavage dioxygenase, class III enzyme, subunit B [Pholiota conissans]
MSAYPSHWKQALESLPSTPEKIPSFFFAHGSPMLAFPASGAGSAGGMMAYHGPNGPLAKFLADFGPILLKKYKPKGIVVFSAHWETKGELTDYAENPLLMDYYGFPPELYKLKFKSRGDSKLAARVVDLYKEVKSGFAFCNAVLLTQRIFQAGLKAKTTSVTESRGEDGRGFEGPGLDHGVFVPFRLMFGEEFTEIPIIQVSLDSSLDPKTNWEAGRAVAKLREEGILILSGGLTAHNLGDRTSFAPDTARAVHKEFDRAIHTAFAVEPAEERKKALFALPKHPGFRASQPREDHFVGLYVADGAGEGGEVKTIVDLYGLASFAFGI